jgi:hypothetical protein
MLRESASAESGFGIDVDNQPWQNLGLSRSSVGSVRFASRLDWRGTALRRLGLSSVGMPRAVFPRQHQSMTVHHRYFRSAFSEDILSDLAMDLRPDTAQAAHGRSGGNRRLDTT